jgi:hypothetical protein
MHDLCLLCGLFEMFETVVATGVSHDNLHLGSVQLSIAASARLRVLAVASDPRAA